MAKTLKEYFKKYLPKPEQESILANAIATSSKIDQNNRIIEVHADFKYVVPKQELYEIELGVANAYGLFLCKILPHYPSVLFDHSYIPQILTEAERTGAVARGHRKYPYPYGTAEKRDSRRGAGTGGPFGRPIYQRKTTGCHGSSDSALRNYLPDAAERI